MRQATRIEMLGDIVRDLIGVARGIHETTLMLGESVVNTLGRTEVLEKRVDELEEMLGCNKAAWGPARTIAEERVERVERDEWS